MIYHVDESLEVGQRRDHSLTSWAERPLKSRGGAAATSVISWLSNFWYAAQLGSLIDWFSQNSMRSERRGGPLKSRGGAAVTSVISWLSTSWYACMVRHENLQYESLLT